MDALIGLLIFAGVIWWFFFKPRTKAQNAIVKSVPMTFIVFDFETTGLSAATNEIIEIGAIKVTQGMNEHQTFQSLVKPSTPISAETTKLTGITQAMIDNEARELSEVLPAFRDFVGDLLMVAFNAQFDQSFLVAACKKTQSPMFSNPLDCALKKARQGFPGQGSYRLADLAQKGKLTMEGQHRALGDSQRAMIVYLASMNAIEKRKKPKK